MMDVTLVGVVGAFWIGTRRNLSVSSLTMSVVVFFNGAQPVNVFMQLVYKQMLTEYIGDPKIQLQSSLKTYFLT